MPQTSTISDARLLVGRLAPSPTGELHIGHARSFLLAWWSVRSRGGKLLLRYEDLDGERSRPEFFQGIDADLRWLGLDWDGEAIVQSDGLGAIEAALQSLVEARLVYPCVCTRREVREASTAPHEGAGHVASAYPGTCRGVYSSIDDAFLRTGRRAALRFSVPTEPVAIEDALLGSLAIDLLAEGGDFVVARSDGIPGYQLAVVVDDAAQGVTEVLRGDDLVVSAARQALLIDALGYQRPTWAHVPLVLDASGERLAKRAGSLSLAALRASGVQAHEVIAWAASSSGQPAPPEPRAQDVLAHFDLARLPLAPVGSPFDEAAP